MRRILSVRYLASCCFGVLFFVAVLIRQSPFPAAAQTCTFSLSSSSQNFAAGGGTGSLAVTASLSSCNWTAASNAPWINISSGASGSGNGTVSYAVSLNPAPTPRNGTLTIAGQTLTLTQDAGLGGLQFYPLATPVRLLDTRSGASGCVTATGAIAANTTWTQPARTACSTIPANATAIIGNITVVPSGPGFLTLFPSDATQPTVANSNFKAGEVTNNFFTVGLGADGAFKLFSSATTDVIIDLTGYYAPPGVGGLYYHPLPSPVRLVETRAGQSGCFQPAQLIGTNNPNADPSLDLQVQGRGPGLPSACNGIPGDAAVLVGNATTVLPNAPFGFGYLSIYPSDAARPTVASSNYATNDVINGPFAVKLGADGKFKIYTFSTTHLVVDITGYYSASATDANGAGLLFNPLPKPMRLLETRPDFPGFPLTGCYRTNTPIQGSPNIRTQPAWGACPDQPSLMIPSTARALAGNATVLNPASAGFATFFPGDVATAPTVATTNYPFPVTFGYNRHYYVGLSSSDGTFKMLTQFTTDLIVDVSGFFAPPPVNQVPIVVAGADQTISLPTTTASLTGVVTDDGLPSGTLMISWSKVSGPGTVNFSAPNQVATNATFSAEGVYLLRLTANDSVLSSNDDVQVTVSPPLLVNAGNDQVVTLPNTAMLMGAVTGGSGTATSEWSKQSGPGAVLFSNGSAAITNAIFAINGVYVLRLTATDGQTVLSDDVQVTVNADPTMPPLDPSTVAPPLDMTVATTIGTATEFLYTGANPIQTGVAPGTINSTRAAILKGRVLDKNNNPLSLVKVTVLDHPELGQTLSRTDGRFDLAVNGGGVFSMKYEKIGYLPVQRTEEVPWQDYMGVPDVVLMGYDPAVTLVDLLNNVPIQVAQSSMSSDSSGARRSTLLFKQGTTALMKLPGGAMAGLDKLHVRATEFTVGANGPQAMPGDLPATSAYTYAVEYSADEAVAAGAIETTFSQPVVQYNENFLNFPAGTVIPSGAYDRQAGQWVPSDSGRVIKILSITGGTANLDVSGNGQPATDPEYAALGINTAERETLATLYTVNQSLWRVPLIHFSSWDSNWPFGPPPDAGPPGLPNFPPPPPDDPPCEDCEREGSIIDVQQQFLGESAGIVGTPFRLNYRSNRVRGRRTDTITIPLSGNSVPASLKRIELKVAIGGRTFTQSFPNTANQRSTFVWDGMDAYGRMMQGHQPATIDVGYVYDGAYTQTARFGYNGNGIPITGDLARREVTLHQMGTVEMGAFDLSALALGGWSLSVHHIYDPLGQVLYQGDGSRRTVQSVNNVILTVAGGGTSLLDGVPATQAAIGTFNVSVGADGNLYLTNPDTTPYFPPNNGGGSRIRKVDQNGIITTIAGTGIAGHTGDGGPALQAQIYSPFGVTVGNDGSLYFFEQFHAYIRRISPNGIITTIAGTGVNGYSGDGGPATQARLPFASTPHPAPDGSIYFADAVTNRIRKIDPSGIITTVAGNGTAGFAGDGGAAAQALFNNPSDVAVGPDSSLYIADAGNLRIRRITPDGIIKTFAGNGGFGIVNGVPATQAPIVGGNSSIAVSRNGIVYFTETDPGFTSYAAIRQVTIDGILNTVTGGLGLRGFGGDGGPATAAKIEQNQSDGVSVSPNGELYFSDTGNRRIRRIGATLPGYSANDLAVPSEDGGQLYRFDPSGRHLSTANALTGATIYQFTYDSAGRLTQITDGDNNVTTIERNGAGNPTGIVGPYGQRTALGLDANGYLSQITDPANQGYQFTYTANGLMTAETDPRNNTHTFTYDSLGRLTKDTDPAGGFQNLARAEQGQDNTVTVTTALNRTSSFQTQHPATGGLVQTNTFPDNTQAQYTERNNGTQTTSRPDSSITNETLGADPRWKMQAPLTTSSVTTTPGALAFSTTFNRAVTLSNPDNPLSLVTLNEMFSINGRSYTSSYTAATQTFVDTSPDGRQATTMIDAQGRTTGQQFANLDQASYGYDARGRLSTATFSGGANTRIFSLAYNADGFLSSVTDALNRVFSLAYDGAGRVTQQTLPDARVIGFGYDANGNLTSLTPPGRPAHTFAYSAINLLTSYTPPAVAGTGPTQFAYNLDKQLTTITRPDALTLNFAYDAAGRLQTLTVPNGAYGFTYNATSNLSSITAPGGGNLSFAYDGSLLTGTTWAGAVAGSVTQVFDNNYRATSQSVNGASTINFTYDNDGLLTGAGALALARDAQNGLITGTTLDSVTDTLGYNGLGELTGYSASFNAAPLYSTIYTRDKLGRITQKVETVGGVTNTYDYTYDLAGRLSTVKLDTVTVASYVYDSNNNRASLTTPGGTLAGTYDAQDRMTAYGATTYSYTPNGELASKTSGAQTTTYSYDVVGNLRGVTLPGGTQIEYVIDGRDRRIGKRVNGVLTQGWLYQDLLKPVAELDGGSNLVSRFVYSSNEDTPDYVVKGGATYRLITDHLGSVRLVVNTTTGAIAERLDYDEFGVVTMDTAPGFQPFGFAGGLYDAQTGLLRFGARDYDPETARWTTKDILLFLAGDINLYGYALNDPLNFIDRDGQSPTAKAGQAAEYLIDPEADGALKILNDQTKSLQDRIGNLKEYLKQLKQPSKKLKERLKKLGTCPKDEIKKVEAEIKELLEEIENRNGPARFIDRIRFYFKATTDPVFALDSGKSKR